jgi:hypothetical protein
MQKVVGSSPIIRLKESPASAGLLCQGVAPAANRTGLGQVVGQVVVGSTRNRSGGGVD